MVSRREFLAHGAAAAAVVAIPRLRRRESICVVVDLGERCELRESLVGYAMRTRAVLSEAKDLPSLVGGGLLTTDAGTFASLRTTGTVIIPAANHIGFSTARAMTNCLHRGGTVLIESGAAFAEFREHHDQLREHFNILLQPPVDLWPARGIPYVEFTWPVPVKVRDFSRVIPLAPQRGRVIARVGDVPVALARRVGRGTLVFLGSPLGPALWSGDAEAKRWLGALLSLGATAQT